MLFKWLNASKATEVGTQLADDVFTQASKPMARKSDATAQNQRLLQDFMQRVDHEARPLRFNVFQQAKLANSFKWRLLEKGIELPIADELTRALVVRLSVSNEGAPAKAAPTMQAGPTAARTRTKPADTQALLDKGAALFSKGAYTEAVSSLRELLSGAPDHAVAHNSLGAALYQQGHYREAEGEFRHAIRLKPNYPDPHCNLGTVLRGRGLIGESEPPLRRALKLKPAQPDFQVNLAMTLLLLGRLPEAKALLEKVLRVAPRDVDAILVLGDIAGNEGRLTDADALYRRALDIAPSTAGAWAGLVRGRKMTSGDDGWLKGAEQAASTGLSPVDEATIRYAMGKYYDDLGDFKRAFRNYAQANELQRATADAYDRDGRERFVDALIGVYTPEALARERAVVADSSRPVFVVGMMRSGTSLVEQIIASHPAARGAGELPYWLDAMRKHDEAVRGEILSDAMRTDLAREYLRLIDRYAPDAARVVDKLPTNSDYLGVIHSVFPNARIIYVQRDPIDTCLSCYFQQLNSGHTFALELSDLAHYYRQHHRLMAHWRSVLPSGAILDVPYDALVADQEGWTRKIVAFLGLEWDERCLEFHTTARPVLTASYWQVRQKMYRGSVGRWRNYEKFIGPLRGLRELA
jgi:tetratricopeptide (TPR) repeat protein